jgi:hypothetical protein
LLGGPGSRTSAARIIVVVEVVSEAIVAGAEAEEQSLVVQVEDE